MPEKRRNTVAIPKNGYGKQKLGTFFAKLNAQLLRKCVSYALSPANGW